MRLGRLGTRSLGLSAWLRSGLALALGLAGVLGLAGSAAYGSGLPADDLSTPPGGSFSRPLRPAVCFAPGTPVEEMEITTAEVNSLGLATSSLDPEPFVFNDSDRWSATATDGSGLSQGDPMTLTWSIVPDGTSIFGYIGEPTADSNLQSFLNGIYGSEAAWLPVFESVFERWSELSGIQYVYEPNDDGSDWTVFTIAGGQLGVRGDIRISGHAIDGTFGVLAYNFFPNTGDMVLDTSDASFTSTGGNSLLLRNTVAHEHGHGLGFEHVCPLDDTKLMEPILALAFDGPQHDDILAVQRGYGDRFEHNDGSGSATDLGVLDVGRVELSDVSVDDNADGDVFGFTLSAPSGLEADLVPVGFTYLSGPQNNNGSCSAGSTFNSLPIHDLGLRVRNAGFGVVATVDATGAGQSEALSELQLPAGQYFVEIFGDTSNEAQLYRLDLTVIEGLEIFTDGFESGNTAVWSGSLP